MTNNPTEVVETCRGGMMHVRDTGIHLGHVKYRMTVTPKTVHDLAVHALIGEEVQAVSLVG